MPVMGGRTVLPKLVVALAARRLPRRLRRLARENGVQPGGMGTIRPTARLDPAGQVTSRSWPVRTS